MFYCRQLIRVSVAPVLMGKRVPTTLHSFFPVLQGTTKAKKNTTANQAAALSTAAIVSASAGDQQGAEQIDPQPRGANPGVSATDASPIRWHETAERNLAVAREVVAAAAAAGSHPELKALLVDPTWRLKLGPELEKPSAQQLQKFLQQEWAQHKIFPPQHLIFRAMNSCPLDDVKVVILGQDPYHNDGQAMGFAFSVPPGQRVPPSLQNIYKELRDDLGCSIPNHGCLTKWAEQGVLLLNTVLTVHAHQANSHAKRGWEAFTDAAITKVSALPHPVVYILWGKPAQLKEKLITRGRHHILKSAHPSGLSAHRGFFGSKFGSQANALLVQSGQAPIDWQIDNIDQ